MVSATVAGTTFRPKRSYTTLRDVTPISGCGATGMELTSQRLERSSNGSDRSWNPTGSRGTGWHRYVPPAHPTLSGEARGGHVFNLLYLQALEDRE